MGTNSTYWFDNPKALKYLRLLKDQYGEWHMAVGTEGFISRVFLFTWSFVSYEEGTHTVPEIFHAEIYYYPSTKEIISYNEGEIVECLILK